MPKKDDSFRPFTMIKNREFSRKKLEKIKTILKSFKEKPDRDRKKTA